MVIGIDEVGRGAWAGPMCVGAVMLGGAEIDGLTDSKKLTKKRREILEANIKRHAYAVGLGWVNARDIDTLGLSAALKLAARRALLSIDTSRATSIVIDGTIRLVEHPLVTTMAKADLLVPSVSAASIVAKVARDRYMAMVDAVVPGYHFVDHVGYGTAAHRAALAQHGPSPIHRTSFAPIDMMQRSKGTGITTGSRAENAAAAYLQRQGYHIVDRNWRTKWCEIDIIAEKAGIVHFVEVKYRKTPVFGGGLEYITPDKRRAMEFAARLWLSQHPEQQGQLAAIALEGDYEVTDWLPLIS